MRRVDVLKLIVGMIVAALSLALAGNTQDTLPEGPGKQTLERVCTACHDLDTVTGTRMVRNEWRAMVDSMMSRGARATDGEVVEIVEYLATYLGMVNVNKAAAGEIAAVLSIPSKEADEIVRYRAANGEFKDLESLMKVPGVDAKVLEERKDRIAFR